MTIGWQEIMLIMVFALLVFGPQRLPEIARQIGRAVAEVRKVSREFAQEVREVTDPVEREIREAERVAREKYALDDGLSRFLPPEPRTQDDEDPQRSGAEPPKGHGGDLT